jgi:GH24 family phage-related lysozyme (muramidase)
MAATNEQIKDFKINSFDKVAQKKTGKWLANSVKILFVWALIFLFLPWTQNINSSGNVTALDPSERPQTIHSTIPGRVEKWFVEEGQYVRKGDTITQQEALIRARVSLTNIQSEVINNFLPRNAEGKRITFTQNEWDAIMSFSYNLGYGWSSPSKATGLRKAIINNDYKKFADKLLEYIKAGGRVSPGLIKRRNGERTLFLKK